MVGDMVRQTIDVGRAKAASKGILHI